MFTHTNRIINVALLLVLVALSACAAPQPAPNMVDYSYVPAAKNITVVTAPGIESF